MEWLNRVQEAGEGLVDVEIDDPVSVWPAALPANRVGHGASLSTSIGERVENL